MQFAPAPRILLCGDTALTVEFGDAIDPALNARVLALDAALRDHPAIFETVPTYRSLLVHYDPVAIRFDELSREILALAADLPATPAAGPTWRIPVTYGGEFGIDLDQTAASHDLAPEELIRRHAAPTYQVYMIGFMPGFALLGGLDPSIATPRRTSPRLKTPAGTISIGGIQALVGSIEAPSGWHLLGRTPVRNFMAGREPVFILKPGDKVKFEPISPTEFGRLERAAEAGEIVAEEVA